MKISIILTKHQIKPMHVALGRGGILIYHPTMFQHTLGQNYNSVCWVKYKFKI